ncbi:MAG: hypothetical protein MI757_03085 [Pirellulales bacterium]|nr:hypothetical protein [Pirellulales bacterium]
MTAPAFDPYLVWLGIPPDARPPTHYQLIGIHQSQTDPKAISAATERRIREVLTLAADCQAAVANRLVREIQLAGHVLLNADKRKTYDEELSSGVKATVKVVAAAPPLPPAGQAVPAAQRPPVPPSTPPKPPITRPSPTITVKSGEHRVETRVKPLKKTRRRGHLVAFLFGFGLVAGALALGIYFAPELEEFAAAWRPQTDDTDKSDDKRSDQKRKDRPKTSQP